MLQILALALMKLNYYLAFTEEEEEEQSRWNSFIQIYPIIQEYSDLDFVD